MRVKKGVTLGDLYPAVLTIVLIGIVLGIGIFILTSSQDAMASTSTTVSDEIITMTGSPVAVATYAECGFTDFALTEVTNSSDVITSGNWTETTDGYVTNLTSEFSGDWVINYTYKGSGDATWCTSITTANTGMAGFATWIAVIVVVIAAAIVLGLVMSSFGARKAGV